MYCMNYILWNCIENLFMFDCLDEDNVEISKKEIPY